MARRRGRLLSAGRPGGRQRDGLYAGITRLVKRPLRRAAINKDSVTRNHVDLMRVYGLTRLRTQALT